jgi:hypothetical protein
LVFGVWLTDSDFLRLRSCALQAPVMAGTREEQATHGQTNKREE